MEAGSGRVTIRMLRKWKRKEDVHQDDEEDFLGQGLLQGGDGAPDQVAAVIEGDQADARGQAGRQGGEPGLDVLDDLVGILAVAHHHDAAHHLPPIHIEGPAAEIATYLNGRDIAQIEGRAVAGQHRDLLQVGDIPHQAHPAHHELGAILLDGLAADVEVARGHGVHDLAQGGAILLQLEGRDLDLILTHEAAHAGDLGHPRHGGELIADIGILEGAQRAQVLATGVVLEVVLIDPAEPGGIGSEPRRHALGQQVAQGIEPFQDPGAGKIDIDRVGEDDGEKGEAEHGTGPHRLDPGEALQGDRERVGDLVLDLLG